MAEDLIERLAREAGMTRWPREEYGGVPDNHNEWAGSDGSDGALTEDLARFAALVAEQCAQTVERAPAEAFCTTVHQGQREANRATFAAAIRAMFKEPTNAG